MTNQTFFDESSEQSKVKAILVRDYFWAWANVILPTVRKIKDGKIAYIDLFAGPGRYKDGTKSTPLLVLESAIEDQNMRSRLVTLFNDASPDNSSSLMKEIATLEGVETLKYKPGVMSEEVGTKIVGQLSRMKLVPTLFFVDPW